jgi:hypothetical protein
MTPKEATALARRAIACPRWRWMPGMVTTHGQRIARVDADGYAVAYYRGGHLQMPEAGALPDLTDPATMGCLLALARKAWNNPDLHVQRDGRFFVVNPTPKGSPLYGDIDAPTEAAVLVTALEAAP